jgi:hypothetical protein
VSYVIQGLPILLSIFALIYARRANIISSRLTFLAEEKAVQERGAAAREERAELSRILHETIEVARKVSFLDEWIFKTHVFTRKREILDAIAAIKLYWRDNEASLSGFLGPKNRIYKGLDGLYKVALQNEDNQPPPSGVGEWRGTLGSGLLLGYTVTQLFDETTRELQKMVR